MDINKLLSNRIRHIEINPFILDLKNQNLFLYSKIKDKKILIIGGAGTIGSLII